MPTFYGPPSDGSGVPAELAAELAVDLDDSTSVLGQIINGVAERKVAAAGLGEAGDTPVTDSARLREIVRAGQITVARPLVAIGDSHTDNTASAANLWDYLKTVGNLPGNGLEGVPADAIVARGNNGQTLRHYLDNPTFGNHYEGTVALDPSVILACWLTNDVRLGGLGETVDAICTNGAALLGELLDRVKADLPDTLVVLRIPAPYTTVDAGNGYIKTAGGTTNPAGLAQTYTDGVRGAYYRAALAKPGVLVYDPQTRYFGTVSPTANTVHYADQIHQNPDGYIAEGRDFAVWVGAAPGFQPGVSQIARAINPRAPFLAYPGDLLDPTRYMPIASGRVLAIGYVEPSGGYLDIEWPPARAGEIVRGDIVVVPGRAPFVFSAGQVGAVATWTRLSSLGTTMDTAAPRIPNSTARVYRKMFSWDANLQNYIESTGYRYKKIGVTMSGNTAVLDIGSQSWGATRTYETGADWVATAQAGDKIYIEGLTADRTVSVGTTLDSTTVTGSFTSDDVGRNIAGTGIPAGAYITAQTGSSATISAAATATGTVTATLPAVVITLAATGVGAFAVSATNLRVSGLSGNDWNQLKGRTVVIVGNHA